MKALPADFCERMKRLLGGAYPDFLSSYALAPARGLRVNTHKLSCARFCEISPWEIEPLPYLEEGFLLKTEDAALGTHPYHLAGLFYVQEPSAMAPVAALGLREGMRVLDLCAAPGGKSTAIAARIGSAGLLVANEIVPNRARVLLQNVQRMGLTNTLVANMQPDTLCARLEGEFEAVLVDAPCSGEGMFRKDDTALCEWSAEHVRACAPRQRAILESAARALCPGGRLVYSTCTFSREENEETVEAFLRAQPSFALLEEKRLYPHNSLGEGQFYAVLQKAGEKALKRGDEAPAKTDKRLRAARDTLAALFPALDTRRMRLLPDGRVILPPGEIPEGLHLLMAGLELGELRKERFEPAHALFQSLGAQCENRLSFAPGDAALAAYLRGETIPAQGASGSTAVCVDGYPLGFGKAVDGVLKNHFPKGLRRIR